MSFWWVKCVTWKLSPWPFLQQKTGHLVFGTLHTSSASQTVDRMVDVFPPDQQMQIRVQLSNSLVAVLSQTLGA